MKLRHVLLCSTLAAGVVPASARAQEKPSLIVLEALEIDPPKPARESLCKPRIRVRNNGGKAVTGFLFGVRLDGQEVSIYKNHVFLQTVAGGEVSDVELYNFWATEAGRPTPRKNGQLRMEVTLKEARWVEVKRDGDRTEYKPLGSVEGLPTSISRVILLGAAR
jgi:hypothetical protein